MCFLIALGILGWNYHNGVTEITPGLFFWSIMWIGETIVDVKRVLIHNINVRNKNAEKI